MKKIIFLCLAAGCCLAATTYKPVTLRQNAQYLTTDPTAVEDTCPGHDIFQPFTCRKEDPAGYSCFDVYQLQGDPIDKERYTLLDETITEENLSAEPLCTFTDLTCNNFLSALNYNLDFSWFISNFPSSSFPQCGDTYSCTRIACLVPLPSSTTGNPLSRKLSCVFKKNQTFFLGAEITCQDKNSLPSKTSK
ncbi:MAG: hypothetical protein IKO35_02600 [Elusimicrobiaceae bacterium]|nr:hypothetical protein [Elusimicrobiaceae bacterium]